MKTHGIMGAVLGKFIPDRNYCMVDNKRAEYLPLFG